MDRSARMVRADGGRVRHRDKRTSRLAVVVALQNVLLTACLAVTLYIYVQGQKADGASESVHIQFFAMSDISNNGTLTFSEVLSNHNMALSGEKNKINVNCSGPYVLYMDLCYQSEVKDSGKLQLQVAGKPICSFPLNATHDVCRGLHCIAYLRAKDGASLHLYTTHSTFKIKNVTVGLSYLLGSQCDK